MKYKYTLIVINSKRDTNGNTYWAFVFIDHESGVKVQGMADGGRGAAEQIRYNFEGPGTGFCDKFLVHYKELPIREFDKYTKKWSYHLCNVEAIQTELQKVRLSANLQTI